jgi:hypothetical protein
MSIVKITHHNENIYKIEFEEERKIHDEKPQR